MSIPRKTLMLRCGLLVLVLATAVGCLKSKEQANEKPAAGAPPRASVTLRVGVVSDDRLAAAINRLRGEWTTRTDGRIETTVITAADRLTAAASEHDLIVFPSRSLGELCEADALRPVRRGVISSDTLRFSDFLPLVKEQEIVYGQTVMALPLGCPTPLLLAAEEGPLGLLAPEGDADLALAYLAWAAPHAVHPSRVATLFERLSFEPRLATPPFVRALERFVEAVGEGPAEVAWPRRQDPLPEGVVPRQIPQADEIYNALAGEWESVSAENGGATLVASSGRLIGVTAASRNAATAFRFLEWLAGPDNSALLATASDSVANCRSSRSRAPDPWRAAAGDEADRAFAAAGVEALRRPRFLIAPRLPGAGEYLGALGHAVRSALGGTSPEEALATAVSDWDAISDKLGREAQRDAYLRSVNAASSTTP